MTESTTTAPDVPAVPLTELLQDDAGSQVAEYALLGGVAVAACAGLAALLKGGLLDALANAVVDQLVDFVKSWF